MTTPTAAASFAEGLRRAFVGAYDESSLASVLWRKLAVRLDVVVPTGGSFDATVFNLVLWAEQHARTPARCWRN